MSLRRSARPEANEQLVAAFTYVEMGDLELMMLHAAAAADVLANKYPDLGEAIELTRLLARSFAVWSDDADRTAMLNYELRISNGSHLETRLGRELHQVVTEGMTLEIVSPGRFLDDPERVGDLGVVARGHRECRGSRCRRRTGR